MLCLLKKTILLGLVAAFLYADETIVIVRHGEKPSNGLGQLSCQGLNRSLKLPNVLESKFGKPDAIFAPNPSKQKADRGVMYDYIRPLATIEPTAIKLGMPVNTQIGFDETDKVASILMDKKFQDSTVFVAWEHHLAVNIAKKLTAREPSIKVPDWANDDFDSIYVIKIGQMGKKVTFTKDSQNLNNQPKECLQY